MGLWDYGTAGDSTHHAPRTTHCASGAPANVSLAAIQIVCQAGNFLVLFQFWHEKP